MKQLMILIAMIATFANTSFAHEIVGDSTQESVASILDFNVNHDWIGYVDQGSISINHTNQTLNLVLMSQPPCDLNMLCAAVMTEYHDIELEIVNSYVDGCGAKIYTAVKDKTLVDGLRETITVTDYSSMLCEIYVPYITTVDYTTYNPWTQETVASQFGAERLYLKPIFFQ